MEPVTKNYMNIHTGLVSTRDGWLFEDEDTGELLDPVALKEVVEVVKNVYKDWVEMDIFLISSALRNNRACTRNEIIEMFGMDYLNYIDEQPADFSNKVGERGHLYKDLELVVSNMAIIPVEGFDEITVETIYVIYNEEEAYIRARYEEDMLDYIDWDKAYSHYQIS